MSSDVAPLAVTVAVLPETAAAIPAPTKFRVVILPAVPTADPSSLIDKPSSGSLFIENKEIIFQFFKLKV